MKSTFVIFQQGFHRFLGIFGIILGEEDDTVVIANAVCPRDAAEALASLEDAHHIHLFFVTLVEIAFASTRPLVRHSISTTAEVCTAAAG